MPTLREVICDPVLVRELYYTPAKKALEAAGIVSKPWSNITVNSHPLTLGLVVVVFWTTGGSFFSFSWKVDHRIAESEKMIVQDLEDFQLRLSIELEKSGAHA